MGSADDQNEAVRATDHLIARAEDRVSSARQLVAAREEARRDTRLLRRVLAVLAMWLSLLRERRAILLRWGDPQADDKRGGPKP